MTSKMGDCIHKDCKYRAANSRDEWQCDYLSITGKSRLLWHRVRGLSTDPAECQCYEKGKRIKPPAVPTTIRKTEQTFAHTTGKTKRHKKIGGEPEPISVLIRRKAEETNPYKDKKTDIEEGRIARVCPLGTTIVRDGLAMTSEGSQRKRATKEDIERRREMVRLGMSDREIAEACGLNLQYLRHWIKKNGIQTQEERQREKAAKGWRKLYESGMGINQIAALYHVPKQEIIRLRNEAGVPPHPRGGNHEAKREKILEALEEMEEV